MISENGGKDEFKFEEYDYTRNVYVYVHILV